MTAAVPERILDVITLGRAAVDLYGEQIGGRLEDVATFAKYLGGCPANIAVGAARLGLKAAVITRVGDDHMGRFVREALTMEGVDVAQVKTDRARLTALAVLGVRDSRTFPLIFYRENCADMALEAGDIDAAFVGRAKALVITGTHLSTPTVLGASRAAVAAARVAGTRVVLDIDYRPVLWGLAGRGEGEVRFVAAADVSHRLQAIAPECDVIVGTEEEIHIAGGSTDTLVALRRLRDLTRAVLVMKQGESGALIFEEAISGAPGQAVECPGFPVEVFNVLGAGDAFMAGLLAGWLRGKDWRQAGRMANACGAIVVSRHGCAPAMPTAVELAEFLSRGETPRFLYADQRIEHLHRVTTRRGSRPEVLALAFDHRRQFEDLCRHTQTPDAGISKFKALVGEAVLQLARNNDGLGAIVDDRYGRDVLDRLSGTGLWIARPVERPGSRPLAFEDDAGPALALRAWPTEHVAKCLVVYDVTDADVLRASQEQSLLALERAADATGREWLLELIPPAGRDVEEAVPAAIEQLYARGLTPDWWKLPPHSDARAWRKIGDLIRKHDPHARGVLILGLDADEAQLSAAFAAGADEPMVRGFAVGRAIFWGPANRWFTGESNDKEAIQEVVLAASRVITQWRAARPTDATDWGVIRTERRA